MGEKYRGYSTVKKSFGKTWKGVQTEGTERKQERIVGYE